MSFEQESFKTLGFGRDSGLGGGGVGGGAGTDGGFHHQGSPGAGGGDRKQSSSLIPLTCHQVLNTEKLSGEIFKSEGRVLNQVTVCGILNGWQASGNGRGVVVSICDTTSTINVTLFGNDVLEKLQVRNHYFQLNHYLCYHRTQSYNKPKQEESRRPMGSRRRHVRIHGHIRPWNVCEIRCNIC